MEMRSCAIRPDQSLGAARRHEYVHRRAFARTEALPPLIYGVLCRLRTAARALNSC